MLQFILSIVASICGIMQFHQHKMFKLLIQTYVLVHIAVHGSQDSPEVQIDQGILKGAYQQTRKGRTFSSFTGIPYAEPPIGDLRFKAAVPASSWEGVFDATKSHPLCPQRNLFYGEDSIMGDEDCLYLNVYTPQLPTDNKTFLPVLYFIHGGGWMYGGAPQHGPEILLDKDIILVIGNYRLGALGFLSTDDEVSPGNNGLKDQTLSIKWIKKNIAQFGGDPDKITIFGQSAGGASVNFHIVSPLSRDLIAGAISQSGTAFSSMSHAPEGEGVRNTKKLATFLNCSTSSSQEIVDCLRKVKAEDIIKQDPKFLEWSYDPIIPFKAVIEPKLEGAFLPEDPIDIIKSGKSANIPYMTGITTEDGAMKSANIYNDTNLVKEFNEDFIKLAPYAFSYYGTASDKNNVSQNIREFYLGDRQIDDSTRNEITNMFTDGWFLVASDFTVRLHRRYSNQPLYYYLFGYRGSTSYVKIFGDPSYDYGVCHSDDLLYLLQAKTVLQDYEPNDSDKKMIDIMTTLWTNFAKTGNPTPDDKDVIIPAKWTPVQSENLEYYHIKNVADIKMGENFYSERAKFWRSLPLDSRRNQIGDDL